MMYIIIALSWPDVILPVKYSIERMSRSYGYLILYLEVGISHLVEKPVAWQNG